MTLLTLCRLDRDRYLGITCHDFDLQHNVQYDRIHGIRPDSNANGNSFSHSLWPYVDGYADCLQFGELGLV